MSEEERRKAYTEFLRFQAEQWAWCFPGCTDYLHNFKTAERARWQCLDRSAEQWTQTRLFAGYAG